MDANLTAPPLAFDNAEFQRLVESLGNDLVPSSPRSFDLVLEEQDLTVRVALHPDDQTVVATLYVQDITVLVGGVRRAVVNSLLLLNHSGLQGRHFFIGLDNRDFVSVFAHEKLTLLDADSFLDWLSYLVRQSVRVRELIQNLSLSGASVSIDFLEAEPPTKAPE